MSKLKQHITFENTGIDTDSNHAFMENGSSPYFLNTVIGEDGSYGIRLNIKGNRQIIYKEPLVLSNCYFSLGGYYNSLRRKVYFFIMSQPYDSGGSVYLYDNRVLCYNEDTETIDTIFRDPKNYLGLDPKEILTDIKMIESWLFYNPVTSEPRMIDVDMAYNYTFYPAYDDTDPSFSATKGDIYTFKGGLFRANDTITAGQDPVNNASLWDRIGNCYQDSSTITGDELYQAFLAIKTPPIDRIKTAYGSDPSASFNNVDGKVFRFAHRYQYFDNSYSVFSSHSDVTLSTDTELYNGERADSVVFNNYISLSFSLYSAALVKSVEIAFQELEGVWKRLAIINRQDQSLLNTVSYTYDFYNNESYPALPTGIVDIIYDAVPKLASTQEIINKNVLCYGGCTEGFDNIDKDLIDVTLTPVIDSLAPEGTYEGATVRDNEASGDITETSALDTSYPDGGRMVYTTDINVDSWFAGAGVASGNVYKAVIDGRTASRTLVAGDVDTDVHLAQAMATTINNAGGVYAYVYTYTTTVTVRISTMDTPIRVNVSKIFTQSVLLTSLSKQGGFKTAAYHPFCLLYYDKALRRGDPQVTPSTVVYVPSVNEYSPPVTTNAGNYRWQIQWAVNHEPPSWARYWRWGYAGNRRCSYFVQYIVSAIADGDSVVSNSIEVDITPLQTIRTTTTSGWNSYPDSTIPAYEFSEGDRIRFMTEATTPATPGTLLGDAINGVYDFEILKFDDTNHKLYVRNFDISGAGASVGENTLVEIYTPRVNTTVEQYYEFGDLMPIGYDTDGNLIHGGITQNQMLTASPQPATGTFSYGDVYHIMRTPSKPLCTNAGGLTNGVFHEAMWWSDFYNSDDWSRGKVAVESLVGQVTLNIIRFSNVFLQNTQVNGITTFLVANQKELNDTYGNIISMVEVGDTLKVYQEKKAASIGIGRTEYMDANGQITVVGSDQILGVVRYSPTNYGTIFAESVVKNNRYVYGFDPYNGVVWRDAPNGLFPISGQYDGTKNGRMVTYFKNKSKAILTSGVDHCNVFQAWDEENKMLYVIFKDIVDKTNNDTVIFHEPTDRWITFSEMDYTPEGGFNEMLELSYEVVRGFELGIGFYFNEETRFAEFDLETPVNNSAFMDLDNLTIESFDPTVQVDGVHDATIEQLLMESFDPTVFISYVRITESTYNWTSAASYGWDNRLTSAFVCSPATATITAIPDWIRVTDNSGNYLSVGSTVTSGFDLNFYPIEENIGGVRSGTVTITNSYGDTDSITLSQAAPILPSYVVLTTEWDAEMTLTNPTGSVTTGSTSVQLDVFPNNPNKTGGESFRIYWRALIGAVNAGTGSFLANDEQTNSPVIEIAIPVNSGETVSVYLIEDKTTDATVTADLSDITITSYDPTVRVSSVALGTPGMTFLATEGGIGDAQSTVITSLPIDGAITIDEIPVWANVANGSGDVLYVGSVLYNGYTIQVFPKEANTTIDLLTGTVSLSTAEGDTTELIISQAAAAAPPAETVLTATCSLTQSTIDAGVTAILGASAYSNTTIVYFNINMDNPAYIEGESYSMYCKVYVNGVDRTLTGTYYFSASNGSVSGSVDLNVTLTTTDVLTMSFSTSYF